MRLVFDCATVPVQWDAATCLASLELERRRLAARGGDPDEPMELVVHLGGPLGGFKGSAAFPRDEAEARACYERIVMPLTELLPRLAGVVETRRAKGLAGLPGFGEKRFGPEHQLRIWRDPAVRAFRLRDAPEPQEDLITITLREAQHWPQRNSDLAAWLGAALALTAAGWNVVVLRDTAQAGAPLPEGFEAVPRSATAPHDLLERARLYAAARLNLFVNAGPALLSYYLDRPTAVLKPFCESHSASSPERLGRAGWQVGTQPPGWGGRQQMRYEPETVEGIVAVVEDMAGKVDREARSARPAPAGAARPHCVPPTRPPSVPAPGSDAETRSRGDAL